MTESHSQKIDPLPQRSLADERARSIAADIYRPLTAQEGASLLHNLQVHQVELETQNEELRSSQIELEIVRKRYFDLFDLAPVGYLTLNEKELILEANLPAAELFSSTRGALRNLPIAQFFLPQDQDILYLFQKKLARTGTTQTCELRLAAPSHIWVSLTATVTQTPGDEVKHQIIMTDITHQKIGELNRSLFSELLGILNNTPLWPEALARVVSAIKRTFQFTAIGIRFTKGEDFPYVAQEGFSEDFLKTENSLLAHSGDGEICRDQAGRSHLECLCGLVLSGRTDPVNPHFTSDGSVWANTASELLTLSPNKDLHINPRTCCVNTGYQSIAVIRIRANNKIVGALHITDNYKNRFSKEMVVFLENICDSLGLAFTRNELADDLGEANRDLEAFGYSAAHDLRNPLNSIMACKSVILKDEESVLGKDSLKALDYMSQTMQRMSSIISDLLSFSKIGRHEIRRQETNLSIMVRNFLTILTSSNAAQGAEAEIVIEPHIIINADSGLMLILIENLLRNAWKFSRYKERVYIEFGTTKRNGFTVFFIRDNGVGFDMAEADKLFKPFQRLHDDPRFKGTGLGLAIVKRIVDKHNGIIWVEAEQDKGAAFFFRLESNSGV